MAAHVAGRGGLRGRRGRAPRPPPSFLSPSPWPCSPPLPGAGVGGQVGAGADTHPLPAPRLEV